MLKATVGILSLLCCVLSAAEEQWAFALHGQDVPFRMWRSDGVKAGVLVLVPGYNGDGAGMLDARWKAFAEKNGLVLLAPTFHAEANENNQGKGYYYPEQGSGAVMEQALREVTRRTGVATDKVLIFGFSAGAHFGHRFALWHPQRVRAFVAYSAAWWSEPTARLRQVPALVMCGEADERYPASFTFFKQGQKLGCPWVWRSYAHTGHELTSSVRAMSEVFLAHYAAMPTQRPATPGVVRYGDIQTFKDVGRADKRTISGESRIELPSPAVAEQWRKDGE
jgi:poly(3-hydroxybutyrate) depolymerase